MSAIANFQFTWFWLIILLPLPWLVWRFFPTKEDKNSTQEQAETALLHPDLERLQYAFSDAKEGMYHSDRLCKMLWLLLWLSLIITAMRPEYLQEHKEVKNPGRDLMLAVDISRSMLALDFMVRDRYVNRMAVVKGVLDKFIAQRENDRIGLILFADSAYLQSPLTYDKSVIRNMLEKIVPRIAGDATAIGDAIGLAVKKLRDRPATSRIVILLTDGENTAGNLAPQDAIQLADKYNIRIYTIGVGSSGNVPFPQDDGSISMEKMPIDEALLKNIADTTRGAYFRASDKQTLEGIYQQINALEHSKAETKIVFIPTPLYRWPLSVALFILLMLAGLALGRGGRW